MVLPNTSKHGERESLFQRPLVRVSSVFLQHATARPWLRQGNDNEFDEASKLRKTSAICLVRGMQQGTQRGNLMIKTQTSTDNCRV